MHESVNTFVGHMCPTRAGNMCPTYCKSNAKLSKSDAYTAHLTTSLLFSCLISFGRCFIQLSNPSVVAFLSFFSSSSQALLLHISEKLKKLSC